MCHPATRSSDGSAGAPRYLFRSPFLLQDEGVLACRPRHDCRPQSSMIRGVLSPGSGRCRRDR
ncbi:hypothetical protein D7Z96_05820 [Pseudarthrobacter phenanthrenivorans]|uniref:Uncharacterized protein n=1 Tax=Pseudarthrobacter phenanthrenivorans TaxID=361575 RepID=A0A3B0G477_PSEPS|nr:hypothetical protein D7Z96_05820 [Pseudarthrobacter phenanthrenivorans]